MVTTPERKLEPQKPTAAFIGASWLALLIGMGAYLVGLWNADLLLSEKGFYGVSMALSVFAVIAVQKNVRDLEAFKEVEQESKPKNLPLKPQVNADVPNFGSDQRLT